MTVGCARRRPECADSWTPRGIHGSHRDCRRRRGHPRARRLQAASRSGHDVVAVGDGAAAVEACQAERPDLVILDVMMPGMSGLDAARVLRQDPDMRRPAGHHAHRPGPGVRHRAGLRRPAPTTTSPSRSAPRELASRVAAVLAAELADRDRTRSRLGWRSWSRSSARGRRPRCWSCSGSPRDLRAEAARATRTRSPATLVLDRRHGRARRGRGGRAALAEARRPGGRRGRVGRSSRCCRKLTRRARGAARRPARPSAAPIGRARDPAELAGPPYAGAAAPTGSVLGDLELRQAVPERAGAARRPAPSESVGWSRSARSAGSATRPRPGG